MKNDDALRSELLARVNKLILPDPEFEGGGDLTISSDEIRVTVNRSFDKISKQDFALIPEKQRRIRDDLEDYLTPLSEGRRVVVCFPNTTATFRATSE
jgi:hypothetical protein